MSGRGGAALLAAVLAAAGGCATPEPHDYGAYVERWPRSILVLPPLNDSPEAQAPYVCLSTLTRPLAELGYYVFPVAVVDAMLRENGLPTPGEMHGVSLRKLDEVFGADAVLYLTIEDFGTSYKLIDSQTTVTLDARLVDVASGVELWRGRQTLVQSASAGSDSLVSMLVNALVNQIATSIVDPSRDVARQTAALMVGDAHDGMLVGPRHPGFEERRQELREAQAAAR